MTLHSGSIETEFKDMPNTNRYDTDVEASEITTPRPTSSPPTHLEQQITSHTPPASNLNTSDPNATNTSPPHPHLSPSTYLDHLITSPSPLYQQPPDPSR
ncbi:hypothetical protein QL285_050955 [Trifolium repens]|nr:hypothetical protein QL285_050955 [Trifolium repens]